MTARKKRSLLRHHVSLTPESGQLEPLPSHGKSQFHPGLPCHLPYHTALHLALSYFSGHRPIPPHLTIPTHTTSHHTILSYPPPYHLILPIPYHLPTLPYSPYHMPQSEPGESHHLPLMSWRTQVTRLVTKNKYKYKSNSFGELNPMISNWGWNSFMPAQLLNCSANCIYCSSVQCSSVSQMLSQCSAGCIFPPIEVLPFQDQESARLHHPTKCTPTLCVCNSRRPLDYFIQLNAHQCFLRLLWNSAKRWERFFVGARLCYARSACQRCL